MRYAIMLLLLCSCASALKISEIMYDAPGSDNNKEYIELYSLDRIDLSGAILIEEEINDTLQLIKLADSRYYLIAEEGFITEGINATVYSAGATIGDNLDNSGDSLALVSDDNVLNISYPGGLADGDGMSISMLNDTWQTSYPTPGSPNDYSEMDPGNGSSTTVPAPINDSDDSRDPSFDLELGQQLEEDLYTGKTYRDLFRLVNNDYSRGIDEIDVEVTYMAQGPENIEDTFLASFKSHRSTGTGSIIFNRAGTYTFCGNIVSASVPDYDSSNDMVCRELRVKDSSEIDCDVSISIETDKDVLDLKEPIEYEHKLTDDEHEYNITYWIEDIYEEVIKDPLTTTNTNKKRYTPSDPGTYILQAKLEVKCNNSGSEEARRLVVIRGRKQEGIRITDISSGRDNTTKYGDTIRVRLQADRSSSAKRKVTLYGKMDKGFLTDTVSLEIWSRDADLTVPLYIPGSCGEGGLMEIVALGLDSNDTEEIYVEGASCYLDLDVNLSASMRFDDLHMNVSAMNPDDGPEEISVVVKISEGGRKICGFEDMVEVKAHSSINRTFWISCPDIEPGIYFLEASAGDAYIRQPIVNIQEKNSASIRSFYTRQKKYSAKTKVYVSIEADSKMNATLLIHSEGSTVLREIDLQKEDLTTEEFELPSHHGNNTYFAELVYADQVDIRRLVIEYPETQESSQKNISLQSQISQRISGSAVKTYESSSQKSKKLIPYISTILLGSVSAFLAFRKL